MLGIDRGQATGNRGGADWAALLVQRCELLMSDYAQRFGIHLA
jgi:hypothetical protein